jgi:GTP-binding protein
MSFVDKVAVTLIAGKGGDGRRSFRHERFIAKGGPDGGDGGDGGDIILRASPNHNTLSFFRYQKQLIAKNGLPGGKSRKHGRNGQSLVIDVPVGTEVTDQKGKLVVDLVIPNQEVVIAKGGKGGFGNAHFTSSTRQAPNFAEKGEIGEKLELILELKIIADVGLVGLPNAGKSTLLSRLSNARPEIADYPFTTLTPNLGVVDIDQKTSLLMADIPGLIEGAAEGKGLGHEFLRHIERTRLIVHVIDIYEEDIKHNYQIIRNELKSYSQKLAKLPEIVAVNKIEGYDQQSLNKKITELKSILPKNTPLITISAQAGTNLKDLKFNLKDILSKHHLNQAKIKKSIIPRITLGDKTDEFKVKKISNGYIVSGQKIERFADRTNFNNDEAVERLRNIMKRLGITHELIRKGLKPGQTIYFGDDQTKMFIF